MRLMCAISEKGGTGKTCLSLNLASVFAEQGPVLVVDADPSQNATWWADRAGDALPFQVATSSDPAVLRKLRRASDFSLIIVDLPGTLLDEDLVTACLDQADFALMPLKAEPASIQPALTVRARYLAHKPYAAVFNQISNIHHPPSAVRQMRAVFAAAGLPVLDHVVHYAKANYVANGAGWVASTYPEEHRAAAAEFYDIGVELADLWQAGDQ